MRTVPYFSFFFFSFVQIAVTGRQPVDPFFPAGYLLSLLIFILLAPLISGGYGSRRSWLIFFFLARWFGQSGQAVPHHRTLRFALHLSYSLFRPAAAAQAPCILPTCVSACGAFLSLSRWTTAGMRSSRLSSPSQRVCRRDGGPRCPALISFLRRCGYGTSRRGHPHVQSFLKPVKCLDWGANHAPL